MEIQSFLKVMVERDASDVYLTADLPPTYRIQGVTHAIGEAVLTNDHLEALAHEIMREKQRREFEQNMEMNLVLYFLDLGRFRVHIFRQRGNVGIVIRQIKVAIVPIDKLGLPPNRKRDRHDKERVGFVCWIHRVREINLPCSHD